MTQTHMCVLPPTQVVFLFLTSLSLGCGEVWQSQQVLHGMLRSWQALAWILPTDHKVQSSLKLRLKFLLTRCHYRWGTWDWEHVTKPSLGSSEVMNLSQTCQQWHSARGRFDGAMWAQATGLCVPADTSPALLPSKQAAVTTAVLVISWFKDTPS